MFSSFLNIDSQRFVGVEQRLYWFFFEDPKSVNSNGIEIDTTYPVSVRFNEVREELCVCTQTNIRFINMFTGKTKRILANLVDNYRDISHLELHFDGKHIIVCDNHGEAGVFTGEGGARVRSLVGHKGEITSVLLDAKNHIIVTAGWDSCIMAQRDGSEGVLRMHKNAHFGGEITAVALSLNHNRLATASGGIILVGPRAQCEPFAAVDVRLLQDEGRVHERVLRRDLVALPGARPNPPLARLVRPRCAVGHHAPGQLLLLQAGAAADARDA